MNKSLITGIVLGAIGITTAGAVASYNFFDKGPEFAEVLDVEPITETVRTPRQECFEEVVTHRNEAADKHQIAGTVIGTVVGGVLGNQVGGGNGKKAATLAGAVAGGYAGKKVQANKQANDTYTTTEQRCETATDTRVNTVGYKVKYQLDGKIDTVRMDNEPGETIPVVNGQLVLKQG